MKKTILWLTIFLMGFCLPSFGYEELEELPINEYPAYERPIIRYCRAPVNIQFYNKANGMLQQVQSAIRCGNYNQALYLLERTYQMVSIQNENPVGVTARGWCYNRRGCRGGVNVNALVTKNVCNATGGKSWKQVTPTVGNCQRI